MGRSIKWCCYQRNKENLAWRTYKVLQASDHIITTVIGYDENNIPITQNQEKK